MIPIEFPKIETLFARDKDTFSVIPGEWRIPEFGLVKPEAWLFQEKIDGTNIRVMYADDAVEVGGRTNNAQTPGDLVAYLYRTFTLERMREAFPDFLPSQGDPVILFGEGYGPGIQKGGGDYRADKGFILFDVKVGGWWLNPTQVEDVAAKLGIPVVPTYHLYSLDDVIGSLSSARLPSICSVKPRLAEGVIMRTEPLLGRRNGDRLIAKLKVSDFRGGKS